MSETGPERRRDGDRAGESETGPERRSRRQGGDRAGVSETGPESQRDGGVMCVWEREGGEREERRWVRRQEKARAVCKV